MSVIVKKFLGLSAVVLLGGSTPAAFASDDAEGSLQHQQKQQFQHQQQAPAAQQQAPAQQLQAPSAAQQQGLTAQQQQQVQQSIAAIVKVPKDQSGKEVPQQAQLRLRIGNMAQQGTTKDVEAIWNEESMDVSDLMQPASDTNVNPEWRGFGFGFRPFFRPFLWGWGFRNPYFYGYRGYNYYYYPRYGYGYGCGYGYRC